MRTSSTDVSEYVPIEDVPYYRYMCHKVFESLSLDRILVYPSSPPLPIQHCEIVPCYLLGWRGRHPTQGFELGRCSIRATIWVTLDQVRACRI